MSLARHQDIAFNVTGQTLYWEAPEGRPSSVTSATVYSAGTGDSGAPEDATTGSPAVDADPDTTFDAASGYGQSDARVINLADTSGIVVGRTYLVENATGEREWPEVVAITSGARVTARNPLDNAYVNGDTFQSTRISIALLTSWVQDSQNLSDGNDPTPGYRVRWVYVVDGTTYVHDSYFDLVRYRGLHGVTPAALDAMYPGYSDTLSTFHREDEGRRLIDEAYEQVRWDWQASDIDDAAIRDRDAVDRAVMLRFGVLMAESQRDPDMLELREKRYREFFDRIFRVTAKVGIATDTTGAARVVPALPLWTK